MLLIAGIVLINCGFPVFGVICCLWWCITLTACVKIDTLIKAITVRTANNE